MSTILKQRRLSRLAVVLILLVVSLGVFFVGPVRSVLADDGGYPYASYDGPGSDATQSYWTDAQGNAGSPYGYDYRNCTDFVAWKLSTANGFSLPHGIGNAAAWGQWANDIHHHYTVDMSPVVGSVAWWGATSSNGYGHVAWVSNLNSDGTVQIEEYNWPIMVNKQPSFDGAYHTRSISASAPSGYIHFPGSGSSPSSTPPRTYIGTQLGPGQSLGLNQYLSENGYTLILDLDGNVRLYAPGSVVMWYPTLSGGGARLTMQTDDNLVLFNSSGGVVWASGTNWASSTCTTCAFLTLVSNGALVIRGNVPTEPVFWSTNWSLTPQSSFAGPEIGPGQSLTFNQYLMVNNYRLTLQLDGNIVFWGQASEVLWTPSTGGQGGDHLTMQTDDNLVLFRADNSVVWASGTDWGKSTCTSCAALMPISAGALVIQAQIPTKLVFWSTNWPVTPSARYQNDIAWYQGNTLFGFQAPSLSTTTSVSGYATPGWVGVGDYNHDGIDDLFWYDGSRGSIYLIPGPNFSSAQLLRGPGVSAPVWAGVGDFSGDGYKDELAWYDGTTLWLFSSHGLATLSGTTGYTTPGWAGVGNYNHTAQDGIFWYQNGSIYFLQSNGSGFPYAQLIRGPGIGAPQWAAVGNFSGDGYRDSIAWYQSNVLFTFEGSSLATTSTITGYSPATWAGVGDYNHDGKDDLYWYQNTTIYVIPSNGPSFNGAFPVRGPGVGVPTWANVGNFYHWQG